MPKARDNYSVTGSTVQELSRTLNFLFQRLADRMDKIEGIRGTATMDSDLDMNGHRAVDLGAPTDDDDSARSQDTRNITGDVEIDGDVAIDGTLDVTGIVTLEVALAATEGGTGFDAFTAGDLLYASSTTALSKLAAGTGVQTLHSGATPSWSLVALTTDVSGVLPVANGGTNISSFTAGDLLYASGATTLTKLAAGTSTQLLHGGTTPSWSAISLSADVTGTLAVASGGTNITSYTAGDIVYASGATTISKLAKGTATQLLHSGTTPSWSAVDLTADVTGILPAANGGTANGFVALSGPATSTKTFTLPNASSTILTDNAAVTAAQGGTGTASYTAGDLIYASGATTLSKLAKGTATQVLHSGTTPSWAAITLTTDVTGVLPQANGGTASATWFNSGATDSAYSDTITWDSTPPSGTTEHRFSWSKNGGVIAFEIRLSYTVAGTTNTSVIIDLPTGMPTPLYLTGVGTSDTVRMINAAMGAGTTTPSLTRQGYLRRNSGGTGFELVTSLNSGSLSAKTAYFSGTYFTTP